MLETIYPRLFLLEYEEGHEVRIEFSKDEHSLDYDNQRDLIKKIFSSTKKGKLTFAQSRKLIDDLDQYNNPPFVPDKDIVEIAGGYHILNGITPQIMKTIFSKSEEEFSLIPETDEMEENSGCFEMCPCGKSHGRIYTKNGMVKEIFHSQSSTWECLDVLFKLGPITFPEVGSIGEGIKNSPLP